MRVKFNKRSILNKLNKIFFWDGLRTAVEVKTKIKSMENNWLINVFCARIKDKDPIKSENWLQQQIMISEIKRRFQLSSNDSVYNFALNYNKS
jgi:hypothetical protein